MELEQNAYARSVYLTEHAWHSALFRAFLQPLGTVPQEDVTIIGKLKSEPYLYLGPASHDLTKLSAAARLMDSEQESYRILHARKVYKGDCVFYIRAILEKE